MLVATAVVVMGPVDGVSVLIAALAAVRFRMRADLWRTRRRWLLLVAGARGCVVMEADLKMFLLITNNCYPAVPKPRHYQTRNKLGPQL